MWTKPCDWRPCNGGWQEMPELRWALMGLGLLFLTGLALWEWRKSRRRHFTLSHVEPAAVIEPAERPRRLEPSIGRLEPGSSRVEPSFDGISGAPADSEIDFDVPTIHPVEPVRVALSAGAAVDMPAAARHESFPSAAASAAPIQWPPANAGRVLALRIVGARGEPLSGRTLRIAFEAAGLRHGPQKIYHLTNTDGVVLASVANLVQPGSFDPAMMDAQQFRGLNVFSVLNGALPSQHMLDDLVGLARALAHRIGAVVQDDTGQDLDGVRLTQLQQSLADNAT
jgi:cell division protein ZipA